MAKFTLSKEQRVHGKKNIEALFQNGEAFFVHPFRVMFTINAAKSQSSFAQIVAIAPKKTFKKAVDRNTIKRKIKEAYRLLQFELNQELLVINQKSIQIAFIFVQKAMPNYQEVSKAISKIIKQLNLKLVESITD